MGLTIVITGGSGRLALNWALAIRERHSVTLGLHSRKVSLSGVSTCRVALEDVESIADEFNRIRPELVVHTAGLTSVEACEENPGLAKAANVELATNVATVCSRLGVRVVHISTDHLFSGRRARAEEEDEVTPQNVYAETKAEAEIRVLDICHDALVVRTNFYGWGPSYKQSFSDFIINSLREGKRISLFKDVFYTPILIEALVKAVHDLIESGARGIINVVADERLSKYQFGCKIAQHFGLNSRLINAVNFADASNLVQRPLDLSLSNRKACKRLGRELGSIDGQIRRLLQQEKLGLVKEIREL